MPQLNATPRHIALIEVLIDAFPGYRRGNGSINLKSLTEAPGVEYENLRACIRRAQLTSKIVRGLRTLEFSQTGTNRVFTLELCGKLLVE